MNFINIGNLLAAVKFAINTNRVSVGKDFIVIDEEKFPIEESENQITFAGMLFEKKYDHLTDRKGDLIIAKNSRVVAHATDYMSRYFEYWENGRVKEILTRSHQYGDSFVQYDKNGNEI